MTHMYLSAEGRISYGHLGRTNSCLFYFVNCFKEELLYIQLKRMNYVPKHLRDHADSEYVSCGVECKGADFIGNRLAFHVN